MIRTLTLYERHVDVSDGFRHTRVDEMDSLGYKPEYVETRIAHSEANDAGSDAEKAYLVSKIRVLDKPFEDADVAADEIEAFVCSCDDFWFNRSKGIETGEISPSELTPCKHIRAAFREERAQEDEKQETLA